MQATSPLTLFSGTAVLVQGKPYDFERDGERVHGVGWRLFMIVAGDPTALLCELRVRADMAARLASSLQFGDSVSVECSQFAKPTQGGRSAVIEYTVERVITDDGEVLAS